MQSHAKSQSRKGTICRILCALAPLRETFLLVSAFGVVTMMACVAIADEVTVNTVLSGLHRPCGIAARPGGTAVRYEVVIAESGAGRVKRWSNLSPAGVQNAIAGFATAAAASPFEQTGPLGLLFVDADLLVVAASSGDGEGGLGVFEFPDEGQTLTAADAIDRPRGPAPPEPSAGAIACYSLTRSRANEFVHDMIVAAIRGADGRTALYKSRVQAGVVGPLQPFWSDSRSRAASRPMVVSTSNTGRIVVVQPAARGDGTAGRLTFLNPIDGSIDLEMSLDLAEVVGLAYSPITGRLYAADFGGDAGGGGIFRIDDASEPGRPACHVVKIADVSRPTALAFAPDGELYVTTFGDSDESGTLQVLTGDL